MAEILKDLYLSWTEKELPQKERTKHVHGLHPYLGKFIPQLVEIFLNLYFKPGNTILDPFMGSGTTLVESNVAGMHSVGVDISAFNCLMVKVKTGEYNLLKLKYEINDALSRLNGILNYANNSSGKQQSFFDLETYEYETNIMLDTHNWYINTWYSERAKKELLAYKYVIENSDYEYKDVLKIILSKSARSARLCPHYELDWPKEPVKEPYYCSKHKRICYPTSEALKFIRRYSIETFNRLKEFSKLRKNMDVVIIHGDSRTVDIGREVDGIFTSPPYCGLIDYHLQHEYAYHFLGLKMQKEKEIGPMEKGQTKKAVEEYKQGIIEVFKNCNKYLKPGAKVIIVVNDKLNLYSEIINESGLIEENRVSRKVNRRTGRRSTDFTEDIIVCRKI